MEIRLNDALDLTALQANARLQVHNVLAAETAERIAQCLERESPWQVAYNADGLLPTFNTLNIFRVPADHSVSMVTPFAGAVRYAITGWFMDA